MGWRLALVLTLLLHAVPSFAAATLPLMEGIYVQKEKPCKDASFAVMLAYREGGISVQQELCSITSFTRSGNTYTLTQHCTVMAQMRKPAEITDSMTVKILNRTTMQTGGKTYRYCYAHL